MLDKFSASMREMLETRFWSVRPVAFAFHFFDDGFADVGGGGGVSLGGDFMDSFFELGFDGYGHDQRGYFVFGCFVSVFHFWSPFIISISLWTMRGLD